MPRHTNVYLRKGTVFLRTVSRATNGIWFATGPCTSLPSGTEPQVLGEAVQRHLLASETGVAFPDVRLVREPLLTAAKVKTWSTFGRDAVAVAVVANDDGTLDVVASEKKKKEFCDLPGGTTRLSSDADARTLGEVVRDALGKSR